MTGVRDAQFLILLGAAKTLQKALDGPQPHHYTADQIAMCHAVIQDAEAIAIELRKQEPWKGPNPMNIGKRGE